MGGAVGGVVSFIGRPFGIYTHNETFSDIQVSNLVTPGEATSGAKRTAKKSARGNAMSYWHGYDQFKRRYKRNYSKKFLENLGYSPSSTARTRTIIDSMVESHLESTLGYADVAINRAVDTYMDMRKKCVYSRQQTSGYDPDTGQLTDVGNTYNYNGCTEVDVVTVNLEFIRVYVDSIVDNLNANYSYDDVAGTVQINGETYTVGEFSSVVNGAGQYETTCTHVPVGLDPQLPDEVIYTLAEYTNRVYTNTLLDEEVTYVEYVVTSGEVGTALRYFIADADTLPIYDSVEVDVTAIIPMKEDNVMVDLESKKLDRMLRRLNLSAEQLRTSIENPDMDGAYLMTAIDIQVHDEIHDKVLFKMFDLLSAGSGNVVISISKLNMRYSFNLVKSTVAGVACPVGSYVRVDGTESVETGIDDEGDPTYSSEPIMTLKYQGSATEYQELVIKDFLQTYTISGEVIEAKLDSTGGYTRLVIPLDLINSLRFKEWVGIYEYSLCMLAFTTEVVEVQWYETSAFGTLLKIVSFVLMVIPFMQGASLNLMALSVATIFVANKIAEMIGGTLGAIIGAAVAIYAFYVMGDMQGLNSTTTWLQAASAGLSVVNQSIVHEIALVQADNERYMEEMQDKIDDLNEKLEEYETGAVVNMFDPVNFGRPNPMFQTTEQYVNSIVNTESLVDGNWMYNIEAQINMRNQVYVG